VGVRDTGTGIDPEYLSTIFEPFVTTKAVGKGTGLGLSTSRAIAVAHGGTLEVNSTLGLGTTFTLSLPWLSDFAPEGHEARPAERLESRGELVLIVDDEGAVRELERQALETFGYATARAKNGLEALEVAERLGSTLDLVLIDNVVPLVKGRALDAQLTASCPDLPVIIMSGSVSDAVDVGIDVLRKPFTTEQLLDVVRARLDGATE
jgi:CheY-like chemotaxis protein